jgi:hypothetical protein
MAPTPCLSAIQSVSSDRTAITRLRGRQVRILYTVHCASLQPQPAARQCHAMMRIPNSECDTVTPGSRVSGTTPPDELTVATDGTLPVCRSDPMSEIPPSTAVSPTCAGACVRRQISRPTAHRPPGRPRSRFRRMPAWGWRAKISPLDLPSRGRRGRRGSSGVVGEQNNGTANHPATAGRRLDSRYLHR